MIQAFKDGEDLHTITAAAIYTEPTEDPAELKLRRQVAKSANFGLLFGSGAKGLRNYAGAMGITMSVEEAAEIRDTFRATYRGITDWQVGNAAHADRTYGDKWAEVRIPVSGLRRYLPGDLNRLTTRCNTPVQGAGAAVLKVALARLWPHLVDAGEDTARLAAVVHDEVVLLVRHGLENEWGGVLSHEMEQAEAIWLGDIPPLAEASYGPTWADAK
jgi:DNA polymerase I-like protein with 3'-5' exonuclease and polymerase domains